MLPAFIQLYNTKYIRHNVSQEILITYIFIFIGITLPGYNLPIFSISDTSNPATTAPPTGTRKFLSVD